MRLDLTVTRSPGAGGQRVPCWTGGTGSRAVMARGVVSQASTSARTRFEASVRRLSEIAAERNRNGQRQSSPVSRR